METKKYLLGEVRWLFDNEGKFIYPHVMDSVNGKIKNVLTGEEINVNDPYFGGNVINAVVNNNETAKTLGIVDCDWLYRTTSGLMHTYSELQPSISAKFATNLLGCGGDKMVEIELACQQYVDVDRIRLMSDKLSQVIRKRRLQEKKEKERLQKKFERRQKIARFIEKIKDNMKM